MHKNNSPFKKIYKKDDLLKPNLFFITLFVFILSSYSTFMIGPDFMYNEFSQFGMVLGEKIQAKPAPSTSEEIPMENDLESFYNDVSKEMSEPIKTNLKPDTSKSNEIKPDSYYKNNKIYKDGKPTIQPEPSIEHPQAKETPLKLQPVTPTSLPIIIDQQTGTPQVETPKGMKNLGTTPDKVVEQAQTVNNLNTIESVELNTDTSITNEPLTYTVKGAKTQNFLGVVEVQIPTTVTYNAETGEFVKSQQSLSSRIVDLFSF